MNPPVWFCGAKITPSFETPKFSGKICDFFRFWASQMLFELSLQIDIKTYRHEIPHPRPPGRRRSDGRVLHETPCPAAVHRRKHRLADQRERLLLTARQRIVVTFRAVDAVRSARVTCPRDHVAKERVDDRSFGFDGDFAFPCRTDGAFRCIPGRRHVAGNLTDRGRSRLFGRPFEILQVEKTVDVHSFDRCEGGGVLGVRWRAVTKSRRPTCSPKRSWSGSTG